MAETTAIAWTDSTFNPFIGCTKVSPGCDNCYAEAMDSRKRWGGGATHWGAGVPRMRTSAENWKQPERWNRLLFFQCNACAHRQALKGDRGERWLRCDRCGGEEWTQTRRRVFCGSLCDVFDNEVPDEWRADLFRLIWSTPALTWLLLTKRIGNARKMLPQWWDEHAQPENVWLGASIVNQAEADRDIPKLLATPASVRFLSLEPLLGPVSFRWAKWHDYESQARAGKTLWHLDGIHGIHWCIVGGESTQGGAEARLMPLDWVRSIASECRDAGVACFVKQLGSRAARVAGLRDRTGADPAEWPEYLRIQQFPAGSSLNSPKE